MRVIALDMSTTRTGWAVGEPGKVESFGSFKKPKDLPNDTEVFLWYAKQITDKAIAEGVHYAVAEDWVRSPSPTQMLRSACLRGAVTVFLKDRMVVDTDFFPPSEWRKAAGMDMKGLPRKGRRKILKQRAVDMCLDLGLQVKNDDEAEACLILIGVSNLIEVSNE